MLLNKTFYHVIKQIFELLHLLSSNQTFWHSQSNLPYLFISHALTARTFTREVPVVDPGHITRINIFYGHHVYHSIVGRRDPTNIGIIAVVDKSKKSC